MSHIQNTANANRVDMQIGIIVSIVVAVVLSIWNAAKMLDNSGTRPVLYVLPPLILLFALAFKRIAFLGVGAVLGLELAMYILFRRPIGQFFSTLIVVAISVAALYSVQIFELLAGWQNEIGANANIVSLGREEIAVRLWQLIHQAQFGHSLLGFGPGAADEVLFRSADILISNPHNDWLKILFEYGLVGFVGLHIVLRLIHSNIQFGNITYIYLSILMTTGNPLIYTYYFVILFLIGNVSSQFEFDPIDPSLRAGARRPKGQNGNLNSDQ